MLSFGRLLKPIKKTSELVFWGVLVPAAVIGIVVVSRYLKYAVDEDEKIFQNIQSDLDSDDIVKVAVIDNKAYWIEDNSLMVAATDADDNIDLATAQPYDAMKAPRRELHMMLMILDALKEG